MYPQWGCPLVRQNSKKNDLHGACPGLLAEGWVMSETDVELGPVDYIVVAFPAGKADFPARWRPS